MDAMGLLLAPCQLGYGIALGCEAAVHTTRLYLNNLERGQVILKLDFENAFNYICRDKMLQAVSILAPEFAPLSSTVNPPHPHVIGRSATGRVTWILAILYNHSQTHLLAGVQILPFLP